MPRFLALIMLSFLVTGAARADLPADPSVALKTSVVVEEAVVRLGDLFEGLGERADTTIAHAPVPGARLQLDAQWLARLARAYGVPWKPRSPLESAIVERASQVIDGHRIQNELAAALAERIEGDFSIVLDNPAVRLHLPTGSPGSIALNGLAYDPPSDRFSATVVAPAEGAMLAQATVTGRVARMAEVPVLRHRMMPGEVIAMSDIDWLAVPAGRLGRSTVLDPAALIGKSPRRPIRPGHAVRATDLRQPVVVAKNSLVTIRLETGRMRLTAQGRALEEGAVGDAIRVMNTKSLKVIIAEVDDSSLVRVAPAN